MLTGVIAVSAKRREPVQPTRLIQLSQTDPILFIHLLIFEVGEFEFSILGEVREPAGLLRAQNIIHERVSHREVFEIQYPVANYKNGLASVNHSQQNQELIGRANLCL
jgi:hypothetical protein